MRTAEWKGGRPRILVADAWLANAGDGAIAIATERRLRPVARQRWLGQALPSPRKEVERLGARRLAYQSVSGQRNRPGHLGRVVAQAAQPASSLGLLDGWRMLVAPASRAVAQTSEGVLWQ